MNEYKSKTVLNFMVTHDFEGDPKELLRKLVYEDLETIESLGGVENIEDRLKFLSSYRGLSEPKLVEMEDDQSGHTDGNQINLNAKHSKSRRLFTWAHEIIHSYFEKSAGIKVDYFGGEFHCSGENKEEEFLCDFGASMVLFYGYEPDSFNIESLLRLIELTGASAEATASSMLEHAGNDQGFVVWSRKCKKGESPDQTSLFSEEKQPFRVDYAMSRSVYLPANKSVNEGDAVDICESDNRSSGTIHLDLHPSRLSLETENLLISNGRVLTLFTKLS
jgi:hypothetical protein